MCRPIRSDTPGGLVGTALALRAALDERIHQMAKWGVQLRPYGTGGHEAAALAEVLRTTCQTTEASRAGGASWTHVLVKEVGEALSVSEPIRLRAELLQVAAIALAWIEDLDSTLAWIEAAEDFRPGKRGR